MAENHLYLQQGFQLIHIDLLDNLLLIFVL